MTPVTVWEKYNNKEKVWEHNHIEISHVDNDRPKPVNELQKKCWSKAEWKKRFSFMDEDGKVL